MIQTQLLRLDPPYQIISAGGRVGIQVATLIVTEDKTTEDGDYAVDTHSHPVVSYGLKQGLDEALKYSSNPDDYSIVDVRILGLAGRNDKVGLRKFVSLVPVERIDGAPTWNYRSLTPMRFFGSELQKVGLSLLYNDETELLSRDKKGNLVFYLEYVEETDIPVICVVLKDGEQFFQYDWDLPIHFYVQLFDGPAPTDDNGKFVGTNRCKTTIRLAMEMLSPFFDKEKITFSYRKRSNHPNEDVVAHLVEELNEAIK